MAVNFQILTEANIIDNGQATELGTITFTEANIYLGLGNGKKVLYSGILPQNYLKTLAVEDEPTTKSVGLVWFKPSTQETYVCYDGTTFTLVNQKVDLDITGSLDGATLANPEVNQTDTAINTSTTSN